MMMIERVRRNRPAAWAMVAPAGAELCPHREALEGAAVRIEGRRPMVVCQECLGTMRQLIRAWHAYGIRRLTVVRRLRELGYSRFDAWRFLWQLSVDRAAIRIGVLDRRLADV